MDAHLRIAREYTIACGHEPDHAKTARFLPLGGTQLQCLLDLGRGDIDDEKLPHSLGDKRLAIVRQGQIDRS